MTKDPVIFLFLAMLSFWLAILLLFAGWYLAGVLAAVMLVGFFIRAVKLIPKRDENDKA